MAASTIKSVVLKSGDTMTGNLGIRQTEAALTVTNTATGIDAMLYNSQSGNHGIYSNGYWTGSKFNSSPTWIIYRDNDGKIKINNYYTIDEVNNAIQQSSALLYDEYNHENGAHTVCMRSGHIVTIRCSGIGSVQEIPQGQDFSFNLRIDSKYCPPIQLSCFGPSRGDYSGAEATTYFIDSSGQVTGYSYKPITGGQFCITFVAA